MKIKLLPSLEILDELFAYCSATGTLARKVGHGPAKAGRIAGANKQGYLLVGIGYQQYLAHRVIWKLWYREDPPMEIDHINGVRHDNKIANLRQASSTQNSANTKAHSDNSTGAKGISWCKTHQNYRARVMQQGQTVTNYFAAKKLGSKELAFEAAKKWAHDKRQELHGKFARSI